MSGESESDESIEWQWAHILWQRRGLRMEDFAEMSTNVRLAYIASEQLAMERPLNSNDRLAKAYEKSK